MSPEMIETLLFSTLRNATPLLYAGIGILLLEKSGLLNLGQEGVIALSAVVAFIVAFETNSLVLAILGACMSAVSMSMIYALLVLVCQASQVVTGLALSIFGVGVAAFFSTEYIGKSIQGITIRPLSYFSDVPILGGGLLHHDIMVYGAWVCVPCVAYLLYRTQKGMLVRASGEDPVSLNALGFNPIKIRFYTLILSSLFVGLAGAYLSIAYTPLLSSGISGGRGWIAIALVVFASHKLGRLCLGAVLFGFTSLLHLVLQSSGLSLPGSILAMIPYLVTIFALIIISFGSKNRLSASPRSLGENYVPVK